MPNHSSLPGVGILLRETTTLLKTFPGHFFGYSSWLLVPVVLSVFSSFIFPESMQTAVDIVLNNILYLILTMWAVVSMMLFAIHTLHQRTLDDKTINTQAWSLLIPYGMISLMTFLLTAAGLVAFLVPGIFLWVSFSFAGVAFVAGDAGLGSAFEKSRSLSKGRFMLVFSRLFQGTLLINLLYACLLFPVILFFSPEKTFNLLEYLNTIPSLGEQLRYNALDILFLPISVAFQVVLYTHLIKTTLPTLHGQEERNA